MGKGRAEKRPVPAASPAHKGDMRRPWGNAETGHGTRAAAESQDATVARLFLLGSCALTRKCKAFPGQRTGSLLKMSCLFWGHVAVPPLAG